MMRFRAILIDPGNASAERPVQILTNSRQDVTEWALGNDQSPGVLAKAVSLDAIVEVYETLERLTDIIHRPKPTEEKKL